MSELRKFELTDQTHPDAPWLRRIRALVDIPRAGVKAGDLGGWVGSEAVLSHSGDAWVYGAARVYGDAWVYGDARVSGDARVYGAARVYGDAWVYGDARVSGDARVYGAARVSGAAQVYGDAQVSEPDHIISAGPLSSEGHPGTLTRQPKGQHQVIIGCWAGTVEELRELIASERWPSGCDAETRARYAPRLLAWAALCDAQMALWEPAGVVDSDA